ncbi:hypothetical protein MRBLMS1_000357 [Massilia sp. LMS1-1-1.1]
MSIGEGAQALIDEELLDGAALGIAQKIAATDSLDGLSPRQMHVYKQFIAPHFDIICQNEDCAFAIEIDFIADAIRAIATGDSVLCQHCIYVNDLNAKDD